jgi:hypothetical protein
VELWKRIKKRFMVCYLKVFAIDAKIELMIEIEIYHFPIDDIIKIRTVILKERVHQLFVWLQMTLIFTRESTIIVRYNNITIMKYKVYHKW